MKLSNINRQILHIAIPSIISNITVPLLGLVDLSIVGHLGSASYIAAIAVGGMLFNVIYWIFGFLRMGTSGMTSQAYGRGDDREIMALLMRSLSVSVIVSVVILIIHPLILDFSFAYAVKSEPDVEKLARLYFSICVWGVPAVLGLYSMTGWYIGMQNSKAPMIVAILQNVVNIVASLCFVYVFDMNVAGVALGTLVAQYFGLFLSIGIWLKYYGRFKSFVSQVKIFERHAMWRFFNVNRDIFFRTLCLVSVTMYFTSAGSSYGKEILSVNAILMQFFTLFSYIMDGFAYAAEAMTGRYVGSGDKVFLMQTVRGVFRWAVFIAVVFVVLYLFAGKSFVRVLTSEESVIALSDSYYYWVLLIPVAGFSAFVWDGVYIGATATRYMLFSMLIATVVFFTIYILFSPVWANHALWLSFISYLLVRGVVQTLFAAKGCVFR